MIDKRHLVKAKQCIINIFLIKQVTLAYQLIHKRRVEINSEFINPTLIVYFLSKSGQFRFRKYIFFCECEMIGLNFREDWNSYCSMNQISRQCTTQAWLGQDTLRVEVTHCWNTTINQGHQGVPSNCKSTPYEIKIPFSSLKK